MAGRRSPSLLKRSVVVWTSVGETMIVEIAVRSVVVWTSVWETVIMVIAARSVVVWTSVRQMVIVAIVVRSVVVDERSADSHGRGWSGLRRW